MKGGTKMMTKKEFKKLISKGYIFDISGNTKDGMTATVLFGKDIHIRIDTGYPKYRLVKEFTCIGNYMEFIPSIITKQYLIDHLDKYLNIQYIDNEQTSITYSKPIIKYFNIHEIDFPEIFE